MRWDLIGRAMRGLVFVLAGMLAATLGAAGTLRFWPAYGLAATFAAVSVLSTLVLARGDPALLERRLSAGPAAETDPAQRLIMTVASALFVALLALPGLDRRLGWSDAGAGTVVLGHLAILVAYAGFLWVFRTNSYAAGTIGVFEGQSVVATGPYRFVRHPMYAAALFFFLGMPLALGSPVSALLVIPGALILAWRIRAEERYLRAHLAGYDAYAERVRWRLVPGLW